MSSIIIVKVVIDVIFYIWSAFYIYKKVNKYKAYAKMRILNRMGIKDLKVYSASLYRKPRFYKKVSSTEAAMIEVHEVDPQPFWWAGRGGVRFAFNLYKIDLTNKTMRCVYRSEPIEP